MEITVHRNKVTFGDLKPGTVFHFSNAKGTYYIKGTTINSISDKSIIAIRLYDGMTGYFNPESSVIPVDATVEIYD